MNTIISHLKSDFRFYGPLQKRFKGTIHLDPVGGWENWAFGEDLTWEHFLSTRTSVLSNFISLVDKNEYVELGFATLPFLHEVCQSWMTIGILEHPLTWVDKALKNKYHTNAGDALGKDIPQSTSDYLKIWSRYTKKIISNCKVFYRWEDLTVDNSRFLQLLNISEKIDFVKSEYQEFSLGEFSLGEKEWNAVATLAEMLGYYPKGLGRMALQEITNPKIINDFGEVSVVIAARNNGIFLKESIYSAINQSVRPLEVIYVDDDSEDDSIRIAGTFPDVKIIPNHRQLGVANSRNVGLDAAKGKYILNLDGDDILPANYIAKKLEVAKKHPEAGFVYSSAQAFGTLNTFWTVPEFNAEHLWCGNYANTSSLRKRSVLCEVGKWREGIGTGWDWDLAIRMIQKGYIGVPSDAILLYRHHDSNHSVLIGLKHVPGQQKDVKSKFLSRFLTRVGRCRITIASIISDRLMGLLPKWIESLRSNIQYHINEIKKIPLYTKFAAPQFILPNISFLYTGSNYLNFTKEINKLKDLVGDITIKYQGKTLNYESEQERRNVVATFLADSYNYLLNSSDAEVFWFLEDDVLPPNQAMHVMLCHLLGRGVGKPLYACSGVYKNRHTPDVLVAHNWNNLEDVNSIENLINIEEDSFVDITGTGCLMIFRPFAKHMFESHFQGIPAHDWNWCLNLKKYTEKFHYYRKQVLLLPEVSCKHYISLNEYV